MSRCVVQLRPPSYAYTVKPRADLLVLVLDAVHPANLGPLPPSAKTLAYKGEQIGLGDYAEFFKKVFY